MPRIPNFPLDNRDAKIQGGRLSVSLSWWAYISFAYKLSVSEAKAAAAERMPKWVTDDFFGIDARAEGNPTKDQMRLMMQSLLADRFKTQGSLRKPGMAGVRPDIGQAGPNGAEASPTRRGTCLPRLVFHAAGGSGRECR